MFQFIKSNISSITLFFITQQEVSQAETDLAERFQEAVTISGTQHFHQFVPSTDGSIIVHETSAGKGLVKRMAMAVDDEISTAERSDVDFRQHLVHLWLVVMAVSCRLRCWKHTKKTSTTSL